MRGFFRHIFQEVYKDPMAKVVGAEIGVCYGLNAFQCLVCFPNLTMHLVDPYKRHDSKISKEASEYILDPFKDRKIFHYTTSEEAAKEFKDGELDFVYIDAEHDFKSVQDDIIYWKSKVRKGGVLGGHDFYALGDSKKLIFGKNGVADAVCSEYQMKDITVSIEPGDWWVDIR